LVGSSGAILVSGSATSQANGLSTTRIAVGPERALVSGLVTANYRSGKASFMQFPFAESFRSASGQRAPRVVLVSYSEQFDSRYYPQRLRTVRSIDGGKTFTPLASDVPINSMTQLVDGSLVAVDFRTTPPTPTMTATPGQHQGTTSPYPLSVCNGSRQGAALVISRSSNEGASWTPARPLVGAGLDGRNVSSADPHLTRMPGGQLILSYGRPGNKILVSTDGNGATWGNLTLTNAGISSGYTSLVALTKTTALQVGDRGSNWCFRAGTGAHKVGIWAKTLTLGTNSGAARLRTND